MTNREHVPGYPAAVADEFRGDDPCVLAYPLGVPERVKDEAKERMRRYLDAIIPKEIDPLTLTNLQPSDVPGVLIAAGPDAIFASLARIEAAKGERAADAAYFALLDRAKRDGRDELASELVHARREIEHAKAAKLRDAIERDQKAKETQKAQQDAMQAAARDAWLRNDPRFASGLIGAAGSGLSLMNQQQQNAAQQAAPWIGVGQGFRNN